MTDVTRYDLDTAIADLEAAMHRDINDTTGRYDAALRELQRDIVQCERRAKATDGALNELHDCYTNDRDQLHDRLDLALDNQVIDRKVIHEHDVSFVELRDRMHKVESDVHKLAEAGQHLADAVRYLRELVSDRAARCTHTRDAFGGNGEDKQ